MTIGMWIAFAYVTAALSYAARVGQHLGLY